MSDDIQEMKQWAMANAQQSRHPEYGDQIIAALEELEKARSDNEQRIIAAENAGIYKLDLGRYLVTSDEIKKVFTADDEYIRLLVKIVMEKGFPLPFEELKKLSQAYFDARAALGVLKP